VGKVVNVTFRQSEVCFDPTRTCEVVVAGLFAGSLGETSDSATSRPDMLFLWPALDATGLLALLNHK
jgi:hypothetical protein